MASHFHIGKALFFFASTSEEHINHVPGVVTVNESPTVADDIKLKALIPLSAIKMSLWSCPWLYKSLMVHTSNLLRVSTPPLDLLRPDWT